MLLLVLASAFMVCPVAADLDTLSFIIDFLRFQRPPALVSAFVCWKQESERRLTLQLSRNHVFLSTHSLDRLRVTPTTGYVTFILDTRCEGAIGILQQANELQMLRRQYRWLLLQSSHFATLSSYENKTFPQAMARPRSDDITDELESILEHLNILLDSDVIIGKRVSEKVFLLLEVYKPRASGGLVKKIIGEWSEGHGLRVTTSAVVAVRRMNLHKALIRAVMVVTDNGTLNHLDDDVDKHVDTYTKTNYAQFKYVTEILNASVEMAITNTWGYSANGSWTGLTGFLQREEADIGSTGMFVLKQRLSVVNFIAATTRTRSAFLFRPPPLSFVMNIFTLPFSRAVWLASVALIAVISFLLYSAFRWEYREKGAMNWTDVVLLSLGAVCQQGSTLEAQGITGRTVTIMLYIVVIFLYTSYSACIVALLQSTTDSIQTLEDLYHSGLTLGAVDVVYSRHFFSTASDPLRHAIYTQKINPSGKPSNFMSLHQGLERVRRGLFAFHHELGPGYKIISDIFLEEEKCGLQTITCFVDFVDPWISVSKQTPFKEIMSIAYRIIHERGLQERENLRYYHKKPKCEGLGSSFVSVGIVDCYPALLVLVYGLMCSVTVLLLEILTYKRFQNNFGS
ncbi:hypothetical protein L798_12953 [Zootermopsis nevadensis]|uniref:Uncharacterized protein n=1 Tax=Zootermopsis nevadensis TaxID=136037 RepID=A0A067R2S3_ZOONE|nr:hypothetical protein L798_12953 [Zootermopsis nevadensis]